MKKLVASSAEATAGEVASRTGAVEAVQFLGGELDWLRTDLDNVKRVLSRVLEKNSAVEARLITMTSDVSTLEVSYREVVAEQKLLRGAVSELLGELREFRISFECRKTCVAAIEATDIEVEDDG